MTRSRPSLRWALIPGRIINFGRNNATCEWVRARCACPERNEIMFGSETFWPAHQSRSEREYIKDAQIALHGGSLSLFCFTHAADDRDWAIYWEREAPNCFARSRWFAAHSGSRDEKNNRCSFCALIALLSFWLIDRASCHLGHSEMSESSKGAPSKLLIGWLTSVILIWCLFLPTCCEVLIEIWFPLIIIVCAQASLWNQFGFSSSCLTGDDGMVLHTWALRLFTELNPKNL